jgi:hypothetical protein
MAYFVRIGAIPTNWSGVGSRGYHIFRRGKVVTVRWGPVEVRPGRNFYWRGKTEKRFVHRSEQSARTWYGGEIERRLMRERYSRLPTGTKILDISRRGRREGKR